MDVFLSYTSEDSALARRLAVDLQEAGATIWLDHNEIQGGSDWARAIDQAISKARNVLFLVPENRQVAGSWQSSEIALAVASQRSDPTKRIIPILVHPRSASELPFFLSRFQAFDLSSEDAYRRGLPELVRLIRAEPRAEAHEESDRIRQKLISLQREALRHQEQELAQGARSASLKFIIPLLSTFVTTLIVSTVILIALEFAVDWRGQPTRTTVLTLIIGAVAALLLLLIQRTVRDIVSAFLHRNQGVKR